MTPFLILARAAIIGWTRLAVSDVEDKFVCTACGVRGADIRPDWQSAEQVLFKKPKAIAGLDEAQ